MSYWHKRANPIDRSVQELEQQITALERQIRRTESQPAATRPTAPTGGGSLRAVADSVTTLVKQMLAPTKKEAPVSYNVQNDLFDAGGETMRELEAEPVVFSRPPDLFQGLSGETGKLIGTQSATDHGRGQDKSTAPDQRLIHYLSAGGIKTYRPLKHVQRRERNRFFMWIGLSLLVAWLVYVIVG